MPRFGGQVFTFLSFKPTAYEYLRWSPDGSALCWDKPGTSRNAPQVSAGIWMIVLGQPEPRLIVKDGYCPVWSEDGAAVYYGVRQGSKGYGDMVFGSRKGSEFAVGRRSSVTILSATG